jgi:hypothetical protein
MSRYGILWIIVAVIVALILFFWLFPMIFGGNGPNNGAAFASMVLFPLKGGENGST